MSLVTLVGHALSRWLREWSQAWNDFWFMPRTNEILAIIRIAGGCMLVYIHVIWASQSNDFFGRHAWIDNTTIRSFHAEDYGWSYLWYVDSQLLLQLHHMATILVSLMMAVGLLSRFTVPLAWALTLMYCHRLTGSLFGLDQIVMMLAMYTMLAPSGGRFSLDAIIERRIGRRWWLPTADPSVATNIAIRLIQVHLCVIYLFGGLSKLRGEMWWDGSALWFAAITYEYQSWDITWIGRYPLVVAILTHATVFWESFYCALVWPKLTRPIMLVIAVFVHGGIAVALGMITFGTMMMVANLAFVEYGSSHRQAE